eukprot:TRINITY_DN21633_c0_g3_i2.p1 TRINITY_DN21633_c0_g3~~TRINITY_DN21633_c0_g3_i2.p1  ORF type:complete len:492 (-),score=104.06 TRINITY_DN21633_c0_g3_i2:128-1408(-)
MKQAKREKTLQEFEENKSGAVLFCTDVAARGLDIPDVHWIVQFDPPQDPSSFVHRAGRTARMGREGDALVYLLPSEIDYIEFLQLRKVPMQEQQKYSFYNNKDQQKISNKNFSCETTENIDENSDQTFNFEQINAQFLSEQDRGVMDKGKKAFVAFVRGYKEHHCRFIFRLEELDAVKLAKAFGLLQMPKMPEIKRLKNVREFKSSEIDINSIPFKDKAREKQRRRLLQEKQQDESQKKQQQIQRRKEDKQQKRDSQVIQAIRQLPKRQRNKLQDREEEKFLQDEYRLLKKLRTKKISEEQFDEATGMIAAQQLQWENKQEKQQQKLFNQQQKQQQQNDEVAKYQSQGQGQGDEEGDVCLDGGDVENSTTQLQNLQKQMKLGRLKKVQIQRQRAERLASLVTGRFLSRVRKKVARKNNRQSKSQIE